MPPSHPLQDSASGRCLDDDTLWSYLQGELDPAEALLVATHYHLSPHARQRLDLLNSCAAAILDDVVPVAMKCCPVEFLNKKCKGQQVKKELPIVQCMTSSVPKPLRPYVDKDFATLKWQAFMEGIESYALNVEGAKAQIMLMRVRGDTQLFEHSHTGDELGLILSGSIIDCDVQYSVGDVIVHRPSEEGDATHAPYVVQDCICLVVLKGNIVRA